MTIWQIILVCYICFLVGILVGYSRETEIQPEEKVFLGLVGSILVLLALVLH